ncbi:MAG: septal ring lytic transglycosylase RlpA family protein [Verrucomicrobiae bacterium]|nr:septal ring lytic transglycosylase RlpA family protein [Verrucomicrobiae bacterium]
MTQPDSIFGARTGVWVIVLLLLAFVAIADVSAQPESLLRARTRQSQSKSETGVASFYAHKYHGKKTASGEVFDMHALTAAHPSLEFGTRVKVTHLENNLSVTVRINDRGPFIKGRVIDLSLAAAKQLQMVQAGLALVKLEIVE